MILTLSLRSQVVIDSAHCLINKNIWMRLNENRLKGTGDMERTQNSREIPMTLNCDLDLESSYWFCTLTH